MLIRSESDIKEFVPTTVAFKFEQIKPILEFTATPELIKWMGSPQYDELLTAFESDPNGMSDKQKQLLKLCRNYLANLSFHYYVAPGSVVFSNNTIGVLENSNLKPASQHKIEQLKRYFIELAGKAEEQVMEYLEKEAATFATWAASSARTTFINHFINSAEQFSEYHEINSSRRLFKAIRTIMKRVETDSILGVICQGLFDEIKSQIAANTVSANNSKLLPYIKTAVAKLTMAEALNELPLTISPEGVQLLSTGDTQNMEIRSTAPAEKIIVLQKKCEQIAADQLRQLVEVMEVNITDYPLYSSSTCYVDPTSSESTSELNDPDDPVIMI
jgi:uncharacterized protein DUF6712